VTFRTQDQVWPRRMMRRGDAVRPLPPHARSLEDLTFEVGDLRLSVSDYMASRRTAGLLILKDGEIALERYGMGSGPESHRTGCSTAKSMTSTLVGAALHDGAIGSLDDRCDLYLPRLRGSVWRQRTPARRGPLRPTGSGGRRGVHGRRVLPPSWRDLVGQPDSAPTAFGLMLGSTAEYGYHWWAVPPLQQRCLFGERRLWPVDLSQSDRAGGHRNPERVASTSGQRRRGRNRRDD
jgi:CubicO group peptidase (beta-lactamase class C family)